MKASKWVNIPSTFMDNSSLLKSLLPVLLAAFVIAVPELFADGNGTNLGLSVTTLQTPSLLDNHSSAVDFSSQGMSLLVSSLSSVKAFLTDDFPVEVEQTANAVNAMFSSLVLIRFAKIIGTDRDGIIARNIQIVATEFPVSLSSTRFLRHYMLYFYRNTTAALTLRSFAYFLCCFARY